MKCKWLIALFLVIVLPAQANDMSMIGVGGSWHPLHGEHPQVRMVSEKIDITINATTYSAVADFKFQNQGPAITVEMGFPEGGNGAEASGQTGSKSTFLTFSSQVDGRNVPVNRVPQERSTEAFQAAWIKKVPFQANQTHHIRVNYQAPLGSAAGMGIEKLVGYDFTGVNWAGEVDSSILTLHFKTPGVYLLNPTFAGKTVNYQSQPDGATFTWSHWQAEGKFKLRFLQTAPGWMISTYNPEQASALKGFSTMAIPGTLAAGARLDWLPPAFMNEGQTLVGLNTFYQELRERFPDLHPALTWNAATRTGTLYIKNQGYAFQPGSRSMKKGQETVNLPAAAMMLQWNYDASLYVPLAPLVQALSGVYVANPTAHRYRFHIEKK